MKTVHESHQCACGSGLHESDCKCTVTHTLTEEKLCECGHDLGVHIPDPAKPFAWPCRACSCSEYKETT